MDEELIELDLAIARARDVATESLDALRAPQDALRAAAAEYIESVARRRVDASRRASTAVMAHLSDDDMVELRFWVEEQIALVRSSVERGIAACDFWIPETSGLSPTDVNTYAVALVPRHQDSESGIPQPLVWLVRECLQSLRHGLGVVGLSNAAAEPEPKLEAALVRRWRSYRGLAIECLINWADVEERYQASTARFQEMRWEVAGVADIAALKAKRNLEMRATRSAQRSTTVDVLAGEPAEVADADKPMPDRPEHTSADEVQTSGSGALASASV